jgi:hypothetical protein
VRHEKEKEYTNRVKTNGKLRAPSKGGFDFWPKLHDSVFFECWSDILKPLSSLSRRVRHSEPTCESKLYNAYSRWAVVNHFHATTELSRLNLQIVRVWYMGLVKEICPVMSTIKCNYAWSFNNINHVAMEIHCHGETVYLYRYQHGKCEISSEANTSGTV